MKIPITIVVDVDPDEYRKDYGTDDTLDEIRADMRDRAVDAMNSEMRFHRDVWFRGVKLKGE